MSSTLTTNRIDQVFQEKNGNILSVYFTAGFPQLNDTVTIMQSLQEAGADIIEIGVPFSDPVADGPTIQNSDTVALANGMSLNLLFEQIKDIRKTVHIPLIMMGYLNPIMQYGIERFCQSCQSVGIDGLIIPDLPVQEYLDEYKEIFEARGLYNIFLISPQTSENRIRQIDAQSKGFIYMVSSASITGAKSGISEEQVAYFERVKNMQLNNPALIGFGISNHETFSKACAYASGAIIGSAFIKMLENSADLQTDIRDFIHSVKSE